MKIEKAAFISFSLGVQIMFEFFNLFQSRCKSLIAVTGTFENPLATLYNIKVPKLLGRMLLKTLSEKIPNLTSNCWHLAFKLPIIHKLGKISGVTNANLSLMQPFYDHQKTLKAPVVIKIGLNASYHSARSILPNINVPTLIIAGGKDKFAPVELSYYMKKNIHKAELLILKEGTHTTIIEYPEEICSKIKCFLLNNQHN